MNKNILNLALPNIVTNITIPLVGMVDLAIVGHLGNEVYISAIAIATMIFNMIYWNFGFLRMGTTGFTAQAYGANNIKESGKILARALILALAFAVLIVSLQKPILRFSFLIIAENLAIQELVEQYFFIRIWAVPAALSLYVLKGWFIGMQDSKLPMWVAIVINLVNVITSLLCAIYFEMGIAGVALGTLIAQYTGVIVFILAFRLGRYRNIFDGLDLKQIFDMKAMLRFFKVNSDIFLRSLCFILIFTFIPAEGSRLGDMTLAVNTLLMQFFTVFAYIMDGFAYAGEALVGRYIGAKDDPSLRQSIRLLFLWGVVLSVLFVIAYAFFGQNILHVFTDSIRVIDAAQEYYYWVLIIPLIAFPAFLWDGVYVGATASKAMRNTIFIATFVFFAVYYLFSSKFGNNALWGAFVAFLALRGIIQFILAKSAIYNYNIELENNVECIEK